MLDELELPYEEAGYRPRSHRKRKSGGGAGKTLFTLVLVFGLLAGLGFGGYWAWGKVQGMLAAADYSGTGKEEVTVVVNRGDSATQIANTLYKEGVVKSARAFVDAANADPRSKNIQPGHYKLKKEMSAQSAVEALVDLKNKVSKKVTIPEGKSNIQTFDVLAKELKLPLEQFVAAAKDETVLSIVSDEWRKVSASNKRPPLERSIEGFLYPETYEFDPNVTAVQVLQAMVRQFVAVVQRIKFESTAYSKNITPYEAVTVASLIVDEGIPSDYGKISRVVYNRLEEPMPLQFDSTTNYWREKTGQGRKTFLTSEENRDPGNKYSTYNERGLPPGPISNAGEAALKAAVNPEQGKWLYFVKIEADGRSAFAETLPEHERNVQECIRKNLGCG